MKKGILIVMAVVLAVFCAQNVQGQQRAPKTKMKNIKGGKKTLKSFKGKVVYVDFWASWCAPCYSSMPSLVSLKQEFGDDLQIVTVSLDKSKRAWKKGYKKARPEGVALWAGPAGQDSKIVKELMIYALPQYVIIDQNGNVVDNAAAGPYQAKEQIRSLIRNKHVTR